MISLSARAGVSVGVSVSGRGCTSGVCACVHHLRLSSSLGVPARSYIARAVLLVVVEEEVVSAAVVPVPVVVCVIVTCV